MKIEEAIEKLSDIRCTYNCFDPKEEPYYRALAKAIAALDSVPIVRCKDCKYRSDYTGYSCKKKIGYWMDDDFCSSGERKEE